MARSKTIKEKIHSPNVKDVAGLLDGLLDGCAEGPIPIGIIEHIEVRRGRQQVLGGLLLQFLSIASFLDDDPLRVAGEGVDSELERPGLGTGGGCAHLSDGEDLGVAAVRGRREEEAD